MTKRYLVQTFGCQMNVHDSQRIEEVLEAHGYAATDDAALADVILFNTCSVREKAEHKLMSALGLMRPLKLARRDLVLVVAGCVAQQEGERLLKRAPFLDVVLGPDNIPELPALVDHVQGGGPPLVRTVFDTIAPTFLTARAKPARNVTAYVTVMKGCDERCSFCIVPYTRGPERYRAADEIVREIATLVDGGVREVTLLGQTVNSWHPPDAGAGDDDAAPESQFPALLRRIAAEVPALARLRYTSPHPRHVTPELVRAHAELDVLAEHVHLPVQSGSDRLLRRMIRRYTRAQYVERARSLCSARTGLTLSTDIIVGFPGETDDDFAATLSLVREVGFVAAFGFKYSPRPYTPALKLGDDVPEDVKDERLAALFEVVDQYQSAHLASLVGTRQRVLVEGPSPRNAPGDAPRLTGRTARNEIVHIAAGVGADGSDPAALVGRLIDADILEANKRSLFAAIAGTCATPAAAPPRPKRVRLAVAPASDPEHPG